jgi:hypothetical protein
VISCFFKTCFHECALCRYIEVTGAYLLGIVQMLVFLNAAGAQRPVQIVTLWLWAGAVGLCRLDAVDP